MINIVRDSKAANLQMCVANLSFELLFLIFHVARIHKACNCFFYSECLSMFLRTCTFCFSHRSRDRLSDFVAEHLDHLHYLNDILTIGLDTLNLVLINHFLSSLFIPLYVFSLTDHASLQWVCFGFCHSQYYLSVTFLGFFF